MKSEHVESQRHSHGRSLTRTTFLVVVAAMALFMTLANLKQATMGLPQRIAAKDDDETHNAATVASRIMAPVIDTDNIVVEGSIETRASGERDPLTQEEESFVSVETGKEFTQDTTTIIPQRSGMGTSQPSQLKSATQPSSAVEDTATIFDGNTTISARNTTTTIATTHNTTSSTKTQTELPPPPPSYHFWDFRRQALNQTAREDVRITHWDAESSNTSNPKSLTLLEQVLHNDYGESSRHRANMEDYNHSCYRPDFSRTQRLLESYATTYQNNYTTSGSQFLQYPIINVGFPKVGSSSLDGFFGCVFGAETSDHSQQGACMQRMANQHKPVIFRCKRNRKVQLLAQMDTNWPQESQNPRKGCIFPQISLLDEIHQEHPNATLVLIHRPVQDWIKSAKSWGRDMLGRWAKCKIPGLAHYENSTTPLSDMDLKQWWCGHVRHIRAFVDQYPSHSLIELNLYNQSQTFDTVMTLFNVPSDKHHCWRHANARASKKKGPTPTLTANTTS